MYTTEQVMDASHCPVHSGLTWRILAPPGVFQERGRGGQPRRGPVQWAEQVRASGLRPPALASTSAKWDRNAPAPPYLRRGVRDAAGGPLRPGW